MKRMIKKLHYVGVPDTGIFGVVVTDKCLDLVVDHEVRTYFIGTTVIHHDKGIFVYGSYDVLRRAKVDHGMRSYNDTPEISDYCKKIVDLIIPFAHANKTKIIRVRRTGLLTGQAYCIMIPNVSDLPL
jgi:hypothetical protein